MFTIQQVLAKEVYSERSTVLEVRLCPSSTMCGSGLCVSMTQGLICEERHTGLSGAVSTGGDEALGSQWQRLGNLDRAGLGRVEVGGSRVDIHQVGGWVWIDAAAVPFQYFLIVERIKIGLPHQNLDQQRDERDPKRCPWQLALPSRTKTNPVFLRPPDTTSPTRT